MEKTIKLSPEGCMQYAQIKPAAYLISQPGAQGGPGEIVVVNEDGRLFRLNYLYGNMTAEQVRQLFPEAAQTQLTLFGIYDNPPQGWIPMYLGLGNHLFGRKDLCPLFAEEGKARNIHSRSEFFLCWADVIRHVLKKYPQISGEVSQENYEVVTEARTGGGNFDIVAENSELMFKGRFTVMDLLKTPWDGKA